MDALLRLLMGQWTTYILWKLHSNGALRFGELRRSVPGISAKVLTDRLRVLEEAEIVTREVIPTKPPQVSYALSERGTDLVDAMEQLFVVAKKWFDVPPACDKPVTGKKPATKGSSVKRA
jgi:DNA-binding HxlR family transcriptional regulator